MPFVFNDPAIEDRLVTAGAQRGNLGKTPTARLLLSERLDQLGIPSAESGKSVPRKSKTKKAAKVA